MSVSFQIFKTNRGWSFATDNRYDLSHWQIDYDSNRISCRPQPMDLIYMLIGTVLFLGLALFFMTLAVKPGWLLRTSAKAAPPAAAQTPSKSDQTRGRSKYEKPVATVEEIREMTEKLKQQLQQDMTPDEREQFDRRLDEAAAQRSKQQDAWRARSQRGLGILALTGRTLAGVGALICGFIGGALCLPRVLLFFRDKIEITNVQGELTLTRPRVFGGTKRRQFPCRNLALIQPYADRRGGRRYAPPYVAWIVRVVPATTNVTPIEFEVEHLHGAASLEKPSTRVRRFVQALQAITAWT